MVDSEYSKIQKMCDKAVPTHPSTIKFVPECYKAQEMRYKTVNSYDVTFCCDEMAILSENLNLS